LTELNGIQVDYELTCLFFAIIITVAIVVIVFGILLVFRD